MASGGRTRDAVTRHGIDLSIGAREGGMGAGWKESGRMAWFAVIVARHPVRDAPRPGQASTPHYAEAQRE